MFTTTFLKDRADLSSSYEKRAFERFQSGFGPKILQALDDPLVDEIMLNCDGSLFIEQKNEGLKRLGSLDPKDSEAVVRTIASLKNCELSTLSPIFSGEIPGSSERFEALLPPLVKNAVFSIRKHNACTLPLELLQEQGLMSLNVYNFLVEALEDKRTIVVSGGTGTGKTTLINALLNKLKTINPKERVLTIEDTRELSVSVDNRVHLYTSDKADMSVLLRSALRLRPDRIVVGEVRGAEALDLIDALSTGHSGGFCTVHAGSISQALKRLTLLISRHPKAPRLIEPTLAEALDVMVQLKRDPTRQICEVSEVLGFKDGEFQIRRLF